VSTVDSQDWNAFLDKFEGFFDYWGIQAGQTVSVDLRVECYNLLQTAVERKLLHDLQDVANLLRPMVCNSEQEQIDFDKAFFSFFRIDRTSSVDSAIPIPPPPKSSYRVGLNLPQVVTIIGLLVFIIWLIPQIGFTPPPSSYNN
jgi:hypothetical protein